VKITIITSLLAKGNMKVKSGHGWEFAISFFGNGAGLEYF
jgi:hypothetical protein